MKKFVLLAVIAVLACGGLFGAYIVRVQTNVTNLHGTFTIWHNGVDMGQTVPTDAITPYVEISKPTKSELFGLWELDPVPSGWSPWNQISYTITNSSAFFPMDNGVDFIFVMSFNTDIPDYTPVELSSFTATLTALNYVQINWITQSESNLLGYRVYRYEPSIQDNAILITPTLIQATNTSQTQSYTVLDNEVEVGSTYLYYLESVEANKSEFFGPVSISVQGEVPPVYPQVSELKNAYPNPFKANNSTTIAVEVKEGENATLSIYNLQGKLVKTFKVGQGSHNISWNGADTNGKACGSGIYLYKLSTQTTNQTKKMVIVK